MSVVSLERAISKLGLTSRKVAHGWILEKRVSINDTLEINPYRFVNLETDTIQVDGKTVSAVEKITVMMNKPAGYLTAHRDHRDRPLVYDLLDKSLPHLNAIGRLDFDTEGLLLFTNDGALFEKLTNPKNEIPRTYEVTIDQPLSNASMKKIRDGFVDREEFIQAKDIAEIAICNYRIVLTTGKYREVRRLIQATGSKVTSLKRIAFGSLNLGSLKTGKTRIVSLTEL